MEDLLPYFERELVYLRRLGREFYERYPGWAAPCNWATTLARTRMSNN